MLRHLLLVVTVLAVGAPVANAATAASSPPSIVIGGDTGGVEENQVTFFVPLAGTKYRVAEQTLPMTASTGCTATADPTEVDCNPFQIENVAAFLHEGNDSFSDNTNLPAIVSGGDGNDTLGGGSGNDLMQGDRGNDFAHGRAGNDFLSDGQSASDGTDQLFGEAGDDRLDGGAIANSGQGGDFLDGGSEVDTLTYSQRSGSLKVTEDGNPNDGQVGEADNVNDIEYLILGSGADRATGDSSADTLDGRNGRDSLNGGAGADRLLGGTGNDILFGSTGADLFSGGAGVDKASYTTRATRVTVTIGVGANDGATGEKDNVLDDVEMVLGGKVGDRLTGEDGANTLVGGTGPDRLAGLGGSDGLNGGAGADVLSGASGDEVITGGPAADQISGATGDDLVKARDGSKDRVDCGTGDDRVTVDAIDVVASNCEHVASAGRAE